VTLIVSAHHDVAEAVPQDRIAAVAEFSGQDGTFQLVEGWHHERWDLAHVHHRQAHLQKVGLHLTRHVRIECDLLDLQDLVELDDLVLDPAEIDGGAGRGLDMLA
jgi:hypothetical protein